jgi:hypothetical protein
MIPKLSFFESVVVTGISAPPCLLDAEGSLVVGTGSAAIFGDLVDSYDLALSMGGVSRSLSEGECLNG